MEKAIRAINAEINEIQRKIDTNYKYYNINYLKFLFDLL